MQLSPALSFTKLFTSGFSLRRRVERDAEALLCMFDQPLCRMGSIAEPCESAVEVQKWLDSLASPFDLVATVHDRAIGFGSLYLGAGNQSHVGTLSVFVHDDFHHRHIGTLLLSVLLSTAETFIGLRRVQLHVFCDNNVAISLYRKFGFEVEGRHECFARRNNVLSPVYSMARLMRREFNADFFQA